MEEKSIPTTREVIKGEEGERHEESIIRPTVSTKQKRIQSQVYSHKLLFSHGGGNVAEDLKKSYRKMMMMNLIYCSRARTFTSSSRVSMSCQ